MMANKNYTSLSGNIMFYNDGCKIKYYPKNLDSYFTDPITFEYFTEPVFFNGNLYEKSTIDKWLSKSNMDPLTGEHISNLKQIVPFNLLKFLLNCLEDNGESLVFYSYPTNIPKITEVNIQNDFSIESILSKFKNTKIYLNPSGSISNDNCYFNYAICVDRWFSEFANNFMLENLEQKNTSVIKAQSKKYPSQNSKYIKYRQEKYLKNMAEYYCK